MNVVAKNIKYIRESANLSQQELAERIIVTRQTISNWERGVSQPDIEIMERIALALEVDVRDLIYGQQPATTFAKTRPIRIRRTILLGILWLIALGILPFLLPELYCDKFDSHLYSYWIGRSIIFLAIYGLGGALALSLLSIWGDFHIKRKGVRGLLLAVGFSIILLYPVLLFATSWTTFHVWIWENPFIFVFAGVFLFCGFFRGPVSDDLLKDLKQSIWKRLFYKIKRVFARFC